MRSTLPSSPLDTPRCPRGSQRSCRPCTQCPVNSYADAIGMLQCTACLQHVESLPGSDEQTDCLCSLCFHGPPGGPCSECPADTYAEALGTAACTACAAPPETQFRSDAQTDCLCSLGFYGSQGWPCTECAANAYADALGTAACTACPADSEVTPRSDAQTDCLCRPGPAPRVCQTLTPLSSTRRSVLRVPQTQRPSAQAPPSQTASVCPDSRGRTAARAQRAHRAPSSPRRAPRPAPTAYMQH